MKTKCDILQDVQKFLTAPGVLRPSTFCPPPPPPPRAAVKSLARSLQATLPVHPAQVQFKKHRNCTITNSQNVASLENKNLLPLF